MSHAVPGRVGSPAPEVHLRAGDAAVSFDTFGRQPVVLAFLPQWDGEDGAPEDALSSIRAELRGIGAVLVLFAPRAVFVFRADDDVERIARGEGVVEDVARARAAFGLQGDLSSALFLVDDARVTRFAQVWSAAEPEDLAALRDALSAAGHALVLAPAVRLSRRELVVASLVASFTLAFGTGCDRRLGGGGAAAGAGDASATSTTRTTSEAWASEVDVTLDVNGKTREVRVDVRTSLLDALRERMNLTGTKKGCDHGQCGACTVLVDGRRVTSCLVLAVSAEGAKITTIEGLAGSGALHPVQRAFISEDALQCGYCTPGQIMSAVGLLSEGLALTDDEVREAMSGNICRCGAYTNIVSAIQKARSA